MDPSYLMKEFKYILQDTNTKFVLTNEAHQQRLASLGQQVEILSIDSELLQERLAAQPLSNIVATAISTSLAM